MLKKTGLLSSPYKRNALISYAIIVVGAIVVYALIAAGALSSALQGQLVPICTYIIMAVSLNLVVGISGELSLGHAGFMAVGAFTGIVVATYFQDALQSDILRFVVAVIAGGIAAGITGFLIGIPVLRLRGDYLAIVTLAFGEIIRNVLNIVYIGMDQSGLVLTFSTPPTLDETGKMILNGPMGATATVRTSTFLMGIVLVLFTLFVVQNIINSKQGRAIMACRDNRIAAESVGLDVTKFKMTAFVTSAFLAGMGGVLFGLNYSTLAPLKFNFNTSVLILVFVVLGEIGNIWGSIIAATILTVLPEALREFADYRMLTYAVVLILVMIFTYNPTLKSYSNVGYDKFRRKFYKYLPPEELDKEVK